MIDAPAPAFREYAAWQITPERQRHDWLRLRKLIVAARVRVVFAGHALFFGVCVLLSMNGRMQNFDLFGVGCGSLCGISLALFALEFLHMKLLPRTPPRFAVRQNGLTEYGEEGPRAHWDWRRTQLLSIETDRDTPGYRTLVLGLKDEAAFLGAFARFHIPLPETHGVAQAAGVDETQIVAALNRALEDNHITWTPRPNGAIVLRHCPARP